MTLPNKAGFAVLCDEDGAPDGKSHLWFGSDTACRMWSTGGLPKRDMYRFFLNPPTQVCRNCNAERHGVEVPAETTLFDLMSPEPDVEQV